MSVNFPHNYSNNSFLHDVLCLRHTPYFSRLPSLKVLVKNQDSIFLEKFLKVNS